MLNPDGTGGRGSVVPRCLAAGLTLSGAALIGGGGGAGILLGVAQLAAAAGLAVRPAQPSRSMLAALVLVPAPLLAMQRWSARLPFTCHCAAPARSVPGLFSLTGLLVAADIGLLVLAAAPFFAQRHRPAAGRGSDS